MNYQKTGTHFSRQDARVRELAADPSISGPKAAQELGGTASGLKMYCHRHGIVWSYTPTGNLTPEAKEHFERRAKEIVAFRQAGNTLAATGQKFGGLTRERIRQIVAASLK